VWQPTGITSSDTQDNLTNVDTGNGSVGLAPSTTHSSLQSIGTGARQHLVDSNDVVRVGADTEMEPFLSGDLDQVPVGIGVRFRRYSILILGPLRHHGLAELFPEIPPGELTCWHRYERLPKPPSSTVRTRWKPGGRRGGTRQRSHAFGQGRRFGSWDQVHRG
jgi:hypothetical protein